MSALSLLGCTVCGAAQVNEAFGWSTLALSLLPLAMIFGVAYWLRRAVKKAAAEEAAEAAHAARAADAAARSPAE